MKRIICTAIVALAAPAFAQEGAPQSDTLKEVTTKGVVGPDVEMSAADWDAIRQHDAVIAYDDDLANLVGRTAYDRGVRVPKALAIASSRIENVVWTRGAPAVFRSSEVAERGFCRDCGTPLSFSYPGMGSLSLAVGSLDDAAAFAPSHVYGVEGRAPWFDELCRLEGTRTEDDIPADELPAYRSRQHPDHD